MCGYLGLALLRASPASGRRISPSPLNGEMSHVDAWLLTWAPFVRSVSISVSLHTLHPQNNQVFQSIYSFNFCAECVHVLTSRRRMGEAFSFNNEQATEELTNAQIIAHIMWNQHCPRLKKKKEVITCFYLLINFECRLTTQWHHRYYSWLQSTACVCLHCTER